MLLSYPLPNSCRTPIPVRGLVPAPPLPALRCTGTHQSGGCSSRRNAARPAGRPQPSPFGGGCRGRGTCLRAGMPGSSWPAEILHAACSGARALPAHSQAPPSTTGPNQPCMPAPDPPSRSTCCGVAHSGVNTSSGSASAIGRNEKMPPPELLISTTVSGGRASPARGGAGWGLGGVSYG